MLGVTARRGHSFVSSKGWLCSGSLPAARGRYGPRSRQRRGEARLGREPGPDGRLWPAGVWESAKRAEARAVLRTAQPAEPVQARHSSRPQKLHINIEADDGAVQREREREGEREGE